MRLAVFILYLLVLFAYVVVGFSIIVVTINGERGPEALDSLLSTIWTIAALVGIFALCGVVVWLIDRLKRRER